jgi:putative ABC transport system substrate-binding protein
VKHSRRRVLAASFFAALAHGALAQNAALPVVGFLSGRSPADTEDVLAAFRQGLRESGYVEGRNVALEYRWARGNYGRLDTLAAELVAHKVAVIAATGGTAAAIAAKRATRTVPVVFISGGDPVKLGLVASLNHPGGNATGASQLAGELEAKKLELLCGMVPTARRIAVLSNPASPVAESSILELKEAARILRRELHLLAARNETDIDAAFAEMRRAQDHALVVVTDAFFDTRRDQLIALSAKHALPAVYSWREYPKAGGLMSYGTNLSDAYRVSGTYVGRILAGAKPADMPVQEAKVELLINRRTAKTLGLSVPQNLLLRADQVLD